MGFPEGAPCGNPQGAPYGRARTGRHSLSSPSLAVFYNVSKMAKSAEKSSVK